MEVDEETPIPTSPVESSATVLNAVIPDVPPIDPIPVPQLISMVPTIAPIPPVIPVPRPLAPLPVRPKPQNGEVKAVSDSDSDAAGSGAEYEISEESRLFREKQEKAKQDFLMKQRASALAVPTNDMAVRSRLRRLGEPITLFGEREMERRDRLRMLMARLDQEGQSEKLMKVLEEEEIAASSVGGAQDGDDDAEIVQYPFYTEGSKSLLEARLEIAKYSIGRAAMRLQRARRKRDDPDEDLDGEVNWALEQAGSLVLDCSEIGDDRPLSGCSFSHDGTMLATW